jgi:hypothetical protein
VAAEQVTVGVVVPLAKDIKTIVNGAPESCWSNFDPENDWV